MKFAAKQTDISEKCYFPFFAKLDFNQLNFQAYFATQLLKTGCLAQREQGWEQVTNIKELFLLNPALKQAKWNWWENCISYFCFPCLLVVHIRLP